MASTMSKYSVFLRIKPVDVHNVDDRMNSDILTVNDSSSITLINSTKKNEIFKCQYNFEKVFKPSATQAELFEDVLCPKLHDFFQEKDCLVFSYGTSNSGKSFTMQGTRDQPGLIPRVLHAMYKSIEGYLDPELCIMPFNSCQASLVDERCRNTLIAEKSAMLGSLHSSVSESHDVSLSLASSDQVTMHLEDFPAIPCYFKDDEVCSVWISFYEVYNEQVFDLLVNNITNLRHPLSLVYDNEDDSYHPKDLKVVNANTWSEAYDLYRYGKRNLRVSETLLNHKSSRSHSVFSLKMLIRVSGTDQYSAVSRFILCDLAGSERMKHTEQMGKSTIKEMLNINASILTLNKCFASLKADTQRKIGGHQLTVVPYRDSKLTKLFKNFLKGHGQLIMVANISQETNLYYQTEQILKITSLAYQTRVEKNDNLTIRLPQFIPKRRFSMMIAQEQSSPVSSLNLAPSQLIPNVDSARTNPEVVRLREENAKLLEDIEKRDLDQQRLLAEKDDLLSRITKMQSHLSREGESRNLYQEKYFELQEKYKNRVTEANRKELELFARMDAADLKMYDLMSKLQEEFGVEDAAGPKDVVSNVIHVHREMCAAATEEVEEFTKIIEELTKEMDTLRNMILERDNEISNLKGQLIDFESIRECEEIRVNSVKSSGDTEADDEVTNSSDSGDNELERICNALVKSHRNARWISDDESSPMRVPPRAKTTIKKKKKTKRLNDIPYHGSSRKARESVSPGTSDIQSVLPARRARRQLMRPADDVHLDQGTPPQMLPGAIMQKTLRSGKRRL